MSGKNNKHITLLALRFKDGDMDAFEELYNLCFMDTVYICSKVLKNYDQGMDVAQDAWIELLTKIHTFRGEASFRTWFYRLAYNLALMKWRKLKVRGRQYEPGDPGRNEMHSIRDKTDVKEMCDARIALDKLLKLLPEGYRKVLVLHDYLGYEHPEIGELLGVSGNTSKTQLCKAKKRMIELFENPLNMKEYKLLANEKCAATIALKKKRESALQNSVGLTY